MREPLVVDASVAIKWFVVEDGSDAAEQLLTDRSDLHAPDLLQVEVANGLRNNCRKRTIEPEQARTGLLSLTRAISRWHQSSGLLPQAFEWALSLDHPVYDFCYLALARTLGIRMVTADARLSSKLRGRPEASLLVHLRDLA